MVITVQIKRKGFTMLRIFCLYLTFLTSSLYSEQTPPQSIYDISVKSVEGQTIPLSAFRGRVLLIVNTASLDRNATQMEQLEELYQKYQEPGFIVLAFPCTDFNNEESGSSSDVRAAYQKKFHVTFPVLEAVHVTGSNKSSLYKYLTDYKTDPNFSWEVDWSFTKFLIARDGKILNRFSTNTLPNDPKVVQAIEKALAQQ